MFRSVGDTDLKVFPLCLGTNVFGWTISDEDGLTLLDRYVEAGGNFLDTADSYTEWAPGNVGGESESLIGRWVHSRGRRDDVVIATKVGQAAGRLGVTAGNIAGAVEDSLRRLKTDYIDLYFAHVDDAQVPLEETLGAMDSLVKSGKVRYIGASNYSGARLAEALDVSDRNGLARYVVLQPEYSLLEREVFERDQQPVCAQHDVAVTPYWSLANGYLTGKYRGGAATSTPRAEAAAKYDDARGRHAVQVLADVAQEHAVSVAAVALAWLAAQPTVVAPIASARNPEQLGDLLAMAELTLTADQLSRITQAATDQPTPAEMTETS